MGSTLERQIVACETRLRRAMLEFDVTVLNELLAADLIFINHLGHVMTRQDDLAAHRSGSLKVEV